MGAAKNDTVANLLSKAKNAIETFNYDYAITLLLSYLEIKPDVLEARQLLRFAQNKKNEGKDFSKPLTQAIVIASNLPGYIKVYLALQKKEWLTLCSEIEKILVHNPKDYFLLSNLALSLDNLGFADAALDTYMQVLAVKDKNVPVLRALAKLYRDKKEDFEQARICCEKILNIVAHDGEATKMLKDMAAIGTIKKGWDDTTTSYRDKIKDVDKAQVFEQESKMVKSDEDIEALIKDNAAKLKETPSNMKIIKTLGSLYLQINKFEEAAQILQKAVDLSPADSALKRDLSSVQLAKYKYMVEQLEKELEKDKKNIDLQYKLKNLIQEKEDFELEECKQRVEFYPTDLEFRFELGKKYMSRDMLNEAITALQAAVKSPVRRVQALNCLGICFKNKKMYDLAKDQLLKAAAGLDEMNAIKKEVIYNLGLVYEEMGEKQKALIEYKKIYEVEINYKDVAARIEHGYDE